MTNSNMDAEEKIEHVYAIAPASNEWVKIGYTGSVSSRLATAQTFHIEDLRVVALKVCKKGEGSKLEGWLQEHYAKDKIVREIFNGHIIADLVKYMPDLPESGNVSELCRACAGRRSYHSQWCEYHKEKKKIDDAERRQSRIEVGLCPKCGNLPALNTIYCQKHIPKLGSRRRQRVSNAPISDRQYRLF